MKNENLDISLKSLGNYFLYLGAIGFGGPAALTQRMEEDLVEEKKWISKDEYVEGFALSQLAPGPLAAQMAIYIGWLKYGNLGAAWIGFLFCLPSFLMCIAIGYLYVKFGSLPWIESVFYIAGPAVVAVIANSSYSLFKKTSKGDRLTVIIWLLSAIYTAFYEEESILLFLISGAILALIRKFSIKSNLLSMSLLPILFFASEAKANSEVLTKIAIYFTKAGAFVFGSGLAIVPFLHSGVVKDFGWLTERQFLDAIAVAMITPGPVVITTAFIGYIVSGLSGAFVAAIATFFPCYLITIACAPFFYKIARNTFIKDVVTGVTVAAVGAIAGACFVIGKRTLLDPFAVFAVLVSLGLLLKFKIKEPVLILGAALIGFAYYFSKGVIA
jgi:chromate transporter